MKLFITLILALALAAIPPVVTQAQAQASSQPQPQAAACPLIPVVVTVVVVVGTIVIIVKVVIPICNKINSNRNWMLTNVVGDALVSRLGAQVAPPPPSPYLPLLSSLEYSNTTNPPVWGEVVTFQISQISSSGTVTVSAYKNDTLIMTQTAPVGQNGTIYTDFSAITNLVPNPLNLEDVVWGTVFQLVSQPMAIQPSQPVVSPQSNP